MAPINALVVAVALGLSAYAQHYTATYLPSNAPAHTEQGQEGTNKCGTQSNQTSMCQNSYLNSVDDFCLFAPPKPGKGSVIGNTESFEVSWCLKEGYGTRLIPDGTIHGAHFVQTPDFVQVTGTGDLTSLNIPKGDEGGELDPHGATGVGNPVGGLVFSSAFGKLQQLHEWTNFMSDSEFCFRACKNGPKAPEWCEHIYDEMGCTWVMPANYAAGTFEKCKADSGAPMGVYGASTFRQGQPNTPPPHPIPSSSSCSKLTSIGNGATISNSMIITATPTPSPTGTTATSSGGISLTTGAAGGSSTGSSSGAMSAVSAPGLERLALAVGTMFVGSLVGAIVIL